MTCVLRSGHKTWEGDTDAEGHRTYNVEWLVESDITDGPANVMQTPGLPIPGVVWQIKSDIDQWAFCLATKSAKRVQGPKEGSPVFLWSVSQQFSTKPPQRQRCQDNKIEDPLLEPPEISIGYNKYTEEATHDLWSIPITNSAYEPIRGPQVEFDKNRGTIKIKQNVASYFQGVLLPSRFIDCVNDRMLWGIPPRCIKLSTAPADRKFYGQCSVYWARSLEFEVDLETYDRYILDEGTKVLHGRWDSTGDWELIDIDGEAPNPFNPKHFDQFKDKNGENCRVVLNGAGLPAGVVTTRRSPPVYYVAITASIGQPLNDGGIWVEIVDGTFLWDQGVTYKRGNIVIFDPTADISEAGVPSGEYYMCLNDDTTSHPDTLVDFALLPDGIVDKGTFSLTEQYATGDRVTPSVPLVGGVESAGTIFVQKYEGVNFLLLGIPPILGV
jgi:hypothetical protein